MTSSSPTVSQKLGAAMRRRNQRLSRASVDISADLRGRHVSGDLRSDVAQAERPHRF